jgi:hypothetical protein
MRVSKHDYYGRPPELIFYHYTTAKAVFESILPDRRLRLSCYTLMRDPQEMKAWGFRFELEEPEWTRKIISDATGWFHAHNYLLSFCLDTSELPPDRGYGRAPMWEQYAENHAGVCLLFDQRKLIQAVKTHLPNTTESGPVRYQRGGFDSAEARNIPDLGVKGFHDRLYAAVSEGNTAQRKHIEEEMRARIPSYIPDAMRTVGGLELLELFTATAIEQFQSQHVDDLLLLKDVAYQAENEYRFVHCAPTSDEQYVYLPFEDSLRALIVGKTFSFSELGEARARCPAGVEFLQMNWDSGWPEPRAPA